MLGYEYTSHSAMISQNFIYARASHFPKKWWKDFLNSSEPNTDV